MLAKLNFTWLLAAVGIVLWGAGPAAADVPGKATRPNVILILTDDQGYGDLHAHGNPIIRTPEMDRLWAQSVRLTNFHVDPTCSPTRSALMTGRYSTRTGVWHTVMGRSLMDPDELTLAEVFAANGYRTAMFGKWHLGDNYPLRAEDQGFAHVVRHGGGGVGQTPDAWGNDYFDDRYWKNGRLLPFEGYCTDVWFREAIAFIRRNREEPFFVYLATNAPHSPYRVPERYRRPYRQQGVPEPMDAFYGMITNLDENLGRLRRELKRLGLERNTLLIFMTDNGTAAGWRPRAKRPQARGYNAGMRGTKGSNYEGGHRVPCFFYWPGGGLVGPRDVDQLAAHIDILPTLVQLCGLRKPPGRPLDGVSLVPALRGNRHALRDRVLLVHSQRIPYPQKWRRFAVMTQRWRLTAQDELYDLESDPGQRHNVAAEFPAVVRLLRQEYRRWWESLRPAFDRPVRIRIGSPREPVTVLTAHDWHCKTLRECPWNQGLIVRGVPGNGPWLLTVERPGRYELRLRRWPPDVKGKPLEGEQATVEIAGQKLRQQVAPQQEEAVFTLSLPAGPTQLRTEVVRPGHPPRGAYYVVIRRLGPGN